MTGRQLSADERAVIEFLLSRPFPWRDELLHQLPHARATDWACECGCPSIELEVIGDDADEITVGISPECINVGFPTLASLRLGEWQDVEGGRVLLNEPP